MTNQQLDALGETVKTQGYDPSSAGTDLVYDPVSGEFRTVPKGQTPSEGETVTNFTKDGFAAEDEKDGMPVIYLDEQSVKEFLSSGERERKGSCRCRTDEGVFHLSANVSRHTSGQDASVFFFRDSIAANTASGHFTGYDDCFVVICDDGTPVINRLKGGIPEEKLDYSFIPAKENLYSRAKGLLEVGVLEKKSVAIIGLGSFGSQIAIELAKAGVGNFSLIDFDRVELHNLMRHTATVDDLGRLKTDVIEEAVLGKNPYAAVRKHPININEHRDVLYDEVEKADLVICATDNNTSRFNLSKALVEKSKVGIFGRAITRAEGGDVFRYRPGGPCYCCIVGSSNLREEEITDVSSARKDGRIAAYVSPEDAQAMVQVGLSSDIEPICNLMVKLALVELSRGTDSGISSLEDELTYDCYIWANRRDRYYSNWKPFPSAGQMPSILRWYGVKVERDEHCPICSQTIRLEEDTDENVSVFDDIEINLQ